MSFGQNLQFLRKMRNRMTHMNVNGIGHKEDKRIIPCFEKEYVVDGSNYMDIYIAAE